MSRSMRIAFITLLSIGVLVSGYRAFDAHQDQRLLLAVYGGDEATAESALWWGADVNHPESPVAIAARMRLLHEGTEGTSEFSRFSFGETRDLLLEHGADINHSDQRGFTALDYIVQTGSIRQVKALVERGADVDSRDDNREHGPHPLILAARARRFRDGGQEFSEVIAYLVKQGSDVNATSIEGHTALYFVSGQDQFAGYEPIQSLLEAGARVSPERPKFSPLHQAARYGQVSNVRMLLNHGAEVDFSHRPSGHRGYTPAFAAAYFGEAREADAVKVLRLLIDAGANLDLELAGMPPIRESPLTQRALAMSEEEIAKLYPDQARGSRARPAHSQGSVEAPDR